MEQDKKKGLQFLIGMIEKDSRRVGIDRFADHLRYLIANPVNADALKVL